MKFTKTAPAESGLYWAITYPGKDPQVVELCILKSRKGEDEVWFIACPNQATPEYITYWGDKIECRTVEIEE